MADAPDFFVDLTLEPHLIADSFRARRCEVMDNEGHGYHGSILLELYGYSTAERAAKCVRVILPPIGSFELITALGEVLNSIVIERYGECE